MLRRDRDCIHPGVVWRVLEAGEREESGREMGKGRKTMQIV
jgi:hypothetical protein